MSYLSLTLFGIPTVSLDNQPVYIRRRKALALLIYLAVTETTQDREELATRFWPEQPHVAARNNLRRALYSLHQALGNNVPRVEHDTVRLPPGPDLWVDVRAFRHAIATARQQTSGQAQLGQAALATLADAVDLFQEDFARGLSLADCAEFENWHRQERESLQVDLIWALDRLCQELDMRGEFDAAIGHARRLLALSPYDEPALQRLLRLYAQSGQSAAAQQLYERQTELWAEDLGVAPSDETQALLDAIRAGAVPAGATSNVLPSLQAPAQAARWIADAAEHTPAAPSPFVTREAVLGELAAHLTEALTKGGRIVFVTGEAGSGKSALLHEFARRARVDRPDLAVASGACVAHFGDGDPYLPFRTLLNALLDGAPDPSDPESAALRQKSDFWQKSDFSGNDDRQQGNDHSPPNFRATAIETLFEQAPLLVNTFIDDFALARHIQAAGVSTATWRQAMLDRLAQRRTHRDDGLRLHEQYAGLLRTLARGRPLLLLLDDLHWADLPSLNLLLYLARQVARSRILIVGAYRPEELSGHGDGSHPLPAVVDEVQRRMGRCRISLDEASSAEGRRFVDALLDLEPNRLDDAFHQALFEHSRGHALFTVELLRQMRADGGLVLDNDRRWRAGNVNWRTLPPRVEAVIARRLRAMPARLQRILRTASVQGERFTADTLAQVLEMPYSALIETLSHTLNHGHQLVHGVGLSPGQEPRVAQYQFRHILFQQYLYQAMDRTERQLLHQATGAALEELYLSAPHALPAAAPLLAHHFEEATAIDKAVAYRRLAGQHAARLSAHETAKQHFTQALDLLQTADADQPQLKLALLLELSVPMAALHGYGHASLEAVYGEAMTLAAKLGDGEREFQAVHGKWRYRALRGHLERAQELAHRLVELADRSADNQRRIEAWRAFGTTRFHRGNLPEARAWLTRSVDRYAKELHGQHMHIFGHDPAISARGYLAHIDWIEGDPAAAKALVDATIRAARALDHPFSLCHALLFNGAHIYQMDGDAAQVLALAQETFALAAQYDFPMWSAAAAIFAGWAEAGLGRPAVGLARAEAGLVQWTHIGSRLALSYHLGVVADAYRLAGKHDRSLKMVEAALAAAAESGEKWWLPKLISLKSQLMDIAEAPAEAK